MPPGQAGGAHRPGPAGPLSARRMPPTGPPMRAFSQARGGRPRGRWAQFPYSGRPRPRQQQHGLRPPARSMVLVPTDTATAQFPAFRPHEPADVHVRIAEEGSTETRATPCARASHWAIDSICALSMRGPPTTTPCPRRYRTSWDRLAPARGALAADDEAVLREQITLSRDPGADRQRGVTRRLRRRALPRPRPARRTRRRRRQRARRAPWRGDRRARRDLRASRHRVPCGCRRERAPRRRPTVGPGHRRQRARARRDARPRRRGGWRRPAHAPAHPLRRHRRARKAAATCAARSTSSPTRSSAQPRAASRSMAPATSASCTARSARAASASLSRRRRAQLGGVRRAERRARRGAAARAARARCRCRDIRAPRSRSAASAAASA